MLSVVRVVRVLVSICVLFALVVCAATPAQARPARDTATLVANDDLDLDLDACVHTAMLPPLVVIRACTPIEPTLLAESIHRDELAILMSAPKTSPPANRT